MLISQAKLRDVLAGIKGAKFATILTETTPKLKGGKSCPLNGIVKLSRVNVTLNFNYEKAVNRQLEREGKEAEFEAEPRKWGNRLKIDNKSACLVVKDCQHEIKLGELSTIPPSKVYLECKVEKALDSVYVLNGKEVPYEEVKPYFYDSTSRQGTDKEVIVRDYSLSSIREITLDKVVYKVV